MSKNLDESFLLKIKNFTLALYTPWQKKLALGGQKSSLDASTRCWMCEAQAMGKLLNGQKNEAPLQTTESILREDTSAF